MQISKFKLVGSSSSSSAKNKTVANSTTLEQLAEHPGWANIKLDCQKSRLRLLLPFYASTFYINLEAPRAVNLMKKVTTSYLGSGKAGSSYLQRYLSWDINPALIEAEKNAIGHSNLYLIRAHLENLGATDDQVITNNSKVLLKGVWEFAENFSRNDQELADTLTIDRLQLIADLVMYIIVGPSAHFAHKAKVMSYMRPYYSEHHELTPQADVDDYAPRSLKDALERFDIDAIRNGSLGVDKAKLEIQRLSKAFNTWSEIHHHFKDENFSTGQVTYDTNVLDQFPIMNFEEFSAILGSREKALLLILADDTFAGYFKNLYEGAKKIPRQPKGVYRRTYRSRQKQNRKMDNFEKEKILHSYLTQIDWTKFRPEPWMLKYIDISILPTLEKLFKIVSKPDVTGIPLLLSKDPIKIKEYVKTFNGKALKAQITGMQMPDGDISYWSSKMIHKAIKICDTDAEVFLLFGNNVKDHDFKREFLNMRLQEQYITKSPFGKLNPKDSARLAQKEDDSNTNYTSDLTLDYRVISKWDPDLENWAEYLKDLLPKTDVLGGEKGTIVVPDKRTDYTPVEEALRSFMSYGHNVDFKIKKVWNLHVCDAAKNFLKNNLNNPNLYIIRNGFHGTHTSAAGSIMLSGFKLKGTEKTARSMGDVLYIAPNLDKSLQYVGSNDKFGHGRGDAIGIIFHGDLAVLGQTPAEHSRGLQDLSVCNWTVLRGRFATEEIGLTDGNIQFILKHAYLVHRTRLDYNHSGGLNQDDQKERTKFRLPIPFQEYIQTSDILTRQTPLPILNKKLLRLKRKEREGKAIRVKKDPLQPTVPAQPIVIRSNALNGVSICWLRGQLQEDIKELLLSNGGTFDESLRKSTTYLVLKNPDTSNRPRAVKAREHNIPLVSTKDIKKILVNKGAI